LSFKDTRQMIRFRIRQSSGSPRPPALFTLPALWKIYRASGGYPRKIVNFCHRSVLTMIVQNRTRAGWMLVRSCVRRSAPGRLRKWPARAGAALVIAAAFVFAAGLFSDKVDVPDLFKTGRGRAVGTPDVPRNSLTTGSVPDHAPAAALLPGSDPAAGAVAVSSVQAGSELLPEQRAMPSLLGRVVLKQNETLWRLIERAYGRFDYELQKLLLAANPEIADPNRVEAGTVISVPAVPIAVKPLQQTLYWVRLAEKSRLEAAIEVLRAYPAEAPPIRIVPYCGAAGEIRFAILDREFFPDKDSAAKRLALLPPSFLDKAEIFSAWRERTVFFADPYRVKK